MPTAVLDLELTKLPPVITVKDHYTHAFILMRYKGKPVGKINLPVTNGCLKTEEYAEQMLSSAEPIVKKAFLHNYLQWNKTDLVDFIPPKATVAICTRNRTEDLKRCLEALMALPDDGQEILVVDNAPSNEDTKMLVMSFPSVRYVLEPRAGLDIARNRAINEAKNEIVAFTDDDAVPDTMWLRALVKNFNTPLVMCVTGMTMPLELETEAQEVFERYSPFGKGFKRKKYTHNSHNPLQTGQVGAGANMAFRKSVLQAVGYFDEALDAGTPTESGGDHEFFARILLKGYQIIYEPEALSWHRHRRTMKETRRAIRGYGIGVYAFWTRLLVKENEWGILKMPYAWFLHTQLPNLWRSILKRPGSYPLHLLLAEIEGCVIGPWKFIKSDKIKNKGVRNDK
jgi:GT2 family glycosyltransferase